MTMMTNVTRENYGDSNSDITKNIYKKYGLTNIDFANNYYLCSENKNVIFECLKTN